MRNIARALSIWPTFACIFGFFLTIAHAQSRHTVPTSKVRPHGAGHVKLLREFIEQSPDLEFVDPSPILGK